MDFEKFIMTAQAQRGLPYLANVEFLRHPIAWRFGVEIKGIMFMYLQKPDDDLQMLREEHPGVFILPNQYRNADFGQMGREELGKQLLRAGIRLNRHIDAADGTGELAVPDPTKDANVVDDMIRLSEARNKGIPHPEYRWWTMKDNASVGITPDDINDFPWIAGYHAFSFELTSPILGNTDQSFRELTKVINLLYSSNLLFNNTGGIDVHRIAAVCLASDAAMAQYHYDHVQDNQHSMMFRTTSNVAHGLSALQASLVRDPAQLDGTVNFDNRRPPPTTIEQCVKQILNADSYGAVDRLMSIDRGVLPANYKFPTYEGVPVRNGPRFTTTVEFRQYSANLQHTDDVIAWIKVCLRVCSFAADANAATLNNLVAWGHDYEFPQQDGPPQTNWRDLFRGYGGLDDVLNYYENDVPLFRPAPPDTPERRLAIRNGKRPEQRPETAERPSTAITAIWNGLTTAVAPETPPFPIEVPPTPGFDPVQPTGLGPSATPESLYKMHGALLESFTPLRPAENILQSYEPQRQGFLADYQRTMEMQNARLSPRSNRDVGGRSMDELKRILGVANGSGSGSGSNNDNQQQQQQQPPPIPLHNPNTVSAFTPERFLQTEQQPNGVVFWVHPNANAIQQADQNNNTNNTNGNGNGGNQGVGTNYNNNNPFFVADRPRNAPFLLIHPSAAGANQELQTRLVQQMQAPPMHSGLGPTGAPAVLSQRDEGGALGPSRYPLNRFQRPQNPAARGGQASRARASSSSRIRRRSGEASAVEGEGFRQKLKKPGCVIS
ncbi:hypothetical protein PG997_002811 [Apiospora hydei]|uniref:Uncharacterized protein n=1 Tax=Apiospora hydei TaxID=1337664 RepID=A0ABR1WXG1_9PEZI